MDKEPKNAIEALKNLIGWITKSARIDSYVSTLHHTCTTTILLLCFFLVSFQQYFGEPIQCVHGGSVSKDYEKAINTFCFISTTYTITTPEKIVNKEMSGLGTETKNSERTYQAYYQWVPIFLFLQIIIFTLPRSLWHRWEGGFVNGMISDVDLNTKEEKIKEIAKYFLERINIHTSWAVGYYLHEILNFVNIIINIVFTDLLLGGYFTAYGLQVFSYWYLEETLDNNSPMDIVFPKLTKCLFYKYGPTGTIESRDTLCVMSLNIVNEKIFVLLWFWFLFLGMVTGLSLVWQLITSAMIQFCNTVSITNIFIGSSSTLTSREQFSALQKNFFLSDWLILSLIAKNLNERHFQQFVEELAQKCDDDFKKPYLKFPETKEKLYM